MGYSIIIDCNEFDDFDIIDVRAKIYLVRPNQELGPVLVRMNDNFRVVETNHADDQVNIQYKIFLIFFPE